jgi:replicative DNA helicase
MSGNGHSALYDAAAERAVLGAVLLRGDLLDSVALAPEDFHGPAGAALWETLQAMGRAGEPIDLVSVGTRLAAGGVLERIGGAAALARLTDAVASTANLEHYVGIVAAFSQRRRLLALAAELQVACADMSRDVREVLGEGERRMADILQAGRGARARPVREIVHQVIDWMQERMNHRNEIVGIPTGLPALDTITDGWQRSEFIVMGARPSVGKSALAMQMAAFEAGWKAIPVGYFSLEMADRSLIARVLTSQARVDMSQVRKGTIRPSDFSKMQQVCGEIYEAPLYIVDEPNIHLLDLRAEARRLVRQHGVRVVYIDYIGLIRPPETSIPRHEQVAEISRSLKSLARELEIPVVALSQLRRESEGSRPSLADLRESGSLEQDADVVLLIHKDKADEQTSKVPVELAVAKQRQGPTSEVPLLFDRAYVRFDPRVSDREAREWERSDA